MRRCVSRETGGFGQKPLSPLGGVNGEAVGGGFPGPQFSLFDALTTEEPSLFHPGCGNRVLFGPEFLSTQYAAFSREGLVSCRWPVLWQLFHVKQHCRDEGSRRSLPWLRCSGSVRPRTPPHGGAALSGGTSFYVKLALTVRYGRTEA